MANTPMTYSVRPAVIADRQLIFALFQPYLSDLSSLPGEEKAYKDANGVYHYPYLDAYWQESVRHPYLLCCDTQTAGFALVRQNGDHWEMAEFYVLPEFRRRGLGSAYAMDIVRKHSGKWEISYNKNNEGGRSLWPRIATKSARSEIVTRELDSTHDYVRFSVGGEG